MILFGECHGHIKGKNNSKCFQLGINLRPSDEYFGCSTAELQKTYDRLGCLTRSMMTNFLHTARRGTLLLLSLLFS